MITGLCFYVVQHVFELLGNVYYYCLLLSCCKIAVYRLCVVLREN